MRTFSTFLCECTMNMPHLPEHIAAIIDWVLVTFMWVWHYLTVHGDGQLICSWQHFYTVGITVQFHGLQ
jgi:hypothetical protein